MAAKVVIVAVPTVLSIASIRVYTVREGTNDGLVRRENLNIYTPLSQSTKSQFVPERPGIVQSALTAARESILPFFQAIKNSYSSVKTGSVELYHAGVDVYYYLKDPPPEFLPRFGTITMAGLLGMFMARKGSRFKRLTVPLGLMSVATSVCYPAQAVAVVKVTGKKMYAAGQWSSAIVSSLFIPKPQERDTKDTACSQPQAAAVTNPECVIIEEASEVQSTTESESFAPVVSDDVSFEMLAENSLTETLIDTVSTETQNVTTAEEIPIPKESEELLDRTQAYEDVSNHTSTNVSTPNVDPEVVEASTTESELSVPVVGSNDSVRTTQSELADPPHDASAEETAATSTTTPPPQQPSAEQNKGGSGFQSDAALMDYGQSSPEDEDLYSTRS